MMHSQNIAKQDFDHTFTVLADGTLTDSDEYAPEVLDDEIDSDRWEFFTDGYTGQYGYDGPMMHNSEYIGGQLESDIRETPGTYVIVAGNYSHNDETDGPEEDCDCDHWEGWAVLKLKGEDNA